MITSKDDNTTASLLGFAIANRADPSNCKSDGNIDDAFPSKRDEKIASKRGNDDGGKNNTNTDRKEKNANQKDNN